LEFACADEASWRESFRALIDLHRARWTTRGESGVLADERVRRWHEAALPGLTAGGLARLYTLRLDGRVIAACYALCDPQRGGAGARATYYYFGGFDPAYERLSPGTLVIGHAVERAVREGCGAFDFLRGREGYKYLWGATDTPTYRRRLWHAGEGRGVA
jgi:CelD/BcsL family acetyltransferase involved in cellulose biosynthesis